MFLSHKDFKRAFRVDRNSVRHDQTSRNSLLDFLFLSLLLLFSIMQLKFCALKRKRKPNIAKSALLVFIGLLQLQNKGFSLIFWSNCRLQFIWKHSTPAHAKQTNSCVFITYKRQKKPLRRANIRSSSSSCRVFYGKTTTFCII